MALLRILKVEALKGFKLKLTLTDGSIIEREVSRLFSWSAQCSKAFEPIPRCSARFALRVARWYGRTAPIFARTF